MRGIGALFFILALTLAYAIIGLTGRTVWWLTRLGRKQTTSADVVHPTSTPPSH